MVKPFAEFNESEWAALNRSSRRIDFVLADTRAPFLPAASGSLKSRKHGLMRRRAGGSGCVQARTHSSFQIIREIARSGG